jgi:ligand-binding SRPBCC domain-containing protein
MTRTYRLQRSQRIERPLPDVFAFFADAANLQALTPPYLGFKILTPQPIEMRAGARIDYEISLLGVPMTWRTLISTWEPNVRFVDEQLSGPYSYWHHTHSFEAEGDATIMHDVVEYRMPLGVLGRIARALFVGRTLNEIFDYRIDATERALQRPADGALGLV